METTKAQSPPSGDKSGRWSYRNWLWVVMFVVMVGGWIYPILGLLVPLCFLGALVAAPFLGRKWCGSWCPRGNFLDRILGLVSAGKPVPSWARHWAVRAGVLAFLMGLLAVRLPQVWGNWPAVGGVFVMILTVTTAVGVVLGLATHQRTWCSLCPAGTMASWMSVGSKPRLTMVNDQCKTCGVCSRKCPMSLEPHRMAQAGGRSQADCVKCGTCVAACRVKSLDFSNTARREDPVSRETEVA